MRKYYLLFVLLMVIAVFVVSVLIYRAYEADVNFDQHGSQTIII